MPNRSIVPVTTNFVTRQTLRLYVTDPFAKAAKDARLTGVVFTPA